MRSIFDAKLATLLVGCVSLLATSGRVHASPNGSDESGQPAAGHEAEAYRQPFARRSRARGGPLPGGARSVPRGSRAVAERTHAARARPCCLRAAQLSGVHHLLARSLERRAQAAVASLRSEVEGVLARARSFVAPLTLHVSPASARLWVDGAQVALRSDQPVMLEVGDHVLDLRAPGYLDERRTLRVSSARAHRAAHHPLERSPPCRRLRASTPSRARVTSPPSMVAGGRAARGYGPLSRWSPRA